MTTSSPSTNGAPALPKASASVAPTESVGPREAIIINVPQPSSGANGGWSDAAGAIATALAWPLTLILLLLIFKAPVTRFIDRLRDFKAPGVEMSTETMIEEELPLRQPAAISAQVDPYSSPLETIITSWVNVEKAARDAALRALPQMISGARTMPYSTVLRNVEALERTGLLTNPDVRPLISDLAKIRNQAVHRPDEQISQDALALFVANANWAVAELLKVRPN